MMVSSVDGTACTGPLQYETEYAVITSDGAGRLDIAVLGGGTATPWDQANTNTRLHINPLQ